MPAKQTRKAATYLDKLKIPGFHLPNLKLMPVAILRDEELLSALNSQPSPCRDFLRPLVDEWIATGIDSRGFENPYERHFGTMSRSEHTKGLAAIDVYDDEGALAFSKATVGQKLSNLEKTVIVFGEEYVRAVPSIDEISLATETPAKAKQGWFAAYLCFMMLATDLRFRIAKCTDCQTYFLLSLRRGTFKSGTRCADCYGRTRLLGAAEITKAGREQSRQEIYSHIARHFGNKIAHSPNWHEDLQLVSNIVESVNGAINSGLKHNAITSKWVVRAKDPDNRSAIYAHARSVTSLRKPNRGISLG
jgi:hypothetical protein